MHRFPPFHSYRCQTSICASSDLAKVATLQQGIRFLPSRPSLPPPFMYRRNPCLPCQNHHFSVWHLCYQFNIPNRQDEPLVVQAWQQKLTAADVSPVFNSLSALALDLRIEEPRASEQPCWCKTADSAHLPWQGKPCWGEQTCSAKQAFPKEPNTWLCLARWGKQEIQRPLYLHCAPALRASARCYFPYAYSRAI